MSNNPIPSLYPDLSTVDSNMYQQPQQTSALNNFYQQPMATTERPRAPAAPGIFPTMLADGKTARDLPFRCDGVSAQQSATLPGRQYITIMRISNHVSTPPGWSVLNVEEANARKDQVLGLLQADESARLTNGKVQDAAILTQLVLENQDLSECTHKIVGKCVNPDEADDRRNIQGRSFETFMKIPVGEKTPAGWAMLNIAEGTSRNDEIVELVANGECARLTDGIVQDTLIYTSTDFNDCTHKIVGKCTNAEDADSDAEDNVAQGFGTDGFNDFASSKKATQYKEDSNIELDPSRMGTDTGMPIVKNPKTSDDFCGYTAHPLLKHLCHANILRLRHFFENKHTKFELRTDNSPHVFVQGKQEEHMINGFTLKVLSLGIVKTKFELSLSDNADVKMITAERPIGASTFINVYFDYFGKHEFIGKVQPTGFNLNRISYNIMDKNHVQLYTFQSGMLRGLFSDGYELVDSKNKKTKYAKYARNGDISFDAKGCKGGILEMKHRMLILAAGMLMKLHV